MERIREYYNFWLGTRLANLEHLKVDMPRAEIALMVFPVGEALQKLLNDTSAPLPMCEAAGIALLKIIVELLPAPPPEPDPWRLTSRDLARIREAARGFDTALSIQF